MKKVVKASPTIKHKLLSSRLTIKKAFPLLSTGGNDQLSLTQQRCEALLGSCVRRHTVSEFKDVVEDTSRWELIDAAAQLGPPQDAIHNIQYYCPRCFCGRDNCETQGNHGDTFSDGSIAVDKRLNLYYRFIGYKHWQFDIFFLFGCAYCYMTRRCGACA